MTRQPRRLLSASAALAALALISCVAPPGAADTADARYTRVPDAFVYCTTCHGVELRGNSSVDAPRLNGMEPWYVRNQMQAFARGWRGTHPEDLIGMEMQPQAGALDAKGLEAAVGFVASVPVRTSTLRYTVTGDADRGATLYATCAACHGARGEGNPALEAPRLVGQSDWYLVRQLEKYTSGSRGHHADDRLGAQMRAAAAVLTGPDDARDVVAYINGLTKNTFPQDTFTQANEETP